MLIYMTGYAVEDEVRYVALWEKPLTKPIDQ
jgi:hypothetical protein